MSVPEVTDLSNEPDHIIKLYGPDCLVPGTYAANCLLARKLSENGVRFVQLYHQGWDQHDSLPGQRSEEHTSELQSLMRISYAVCCLHKTKRTNKKTTALYT